MNIFWIILKVIVFVAWTGYVDYRAVKSVHDKNVVMPIKVINTCEEKLPRNQFCKLVAVPVVNKEDR